jgi:hypothetical protein
MSQVRLLCTTRIGCNQDRFGIKVLELHLRVAALIGARLRVLAQSVQEPTSVGKPEVVVEAIQTYMPVDRQR